MIWKKGIPLVDEICPTCGVTFRAVGYGKPGTSQKYKKCPSGHEHSAFHLVEHRKTLDMPKTLERALRDQGISRNRIDSLEIGLQAMVGAYERLVRTLPERSQARAMVDGVFQAPVKLARELMA